MKKKPTDQKKTLRLFGYDWKLEVTNDKTKEAGGSFTWSTRKIVINDRYGELHSILFHEVIEAVLVQNLARFYGQEGNTEYHFFFTHTQFTKIATSIFQAFEDNKEIMFKK
jgi:hypothetical protein